jgi:hypothetical protein
MVDMTMLERLNVLETTCSGAPRRRNVSTRPFSSEPFSLTSVTKVPSRHALESALQKLGFAETRKPLDEAISPPAKTVSNTQNQN